MLTQNDNGKPRLVKITVKEKQIMPKCPKCGSELQPAEGDLLQCPNCGIKFRLQKPAQKPAQATEPKDEKPQAKEEMSDQEKIKALEERLAALEAEKQTKRDKTQSPLKTVFAKEGKLALFFKKYWVYLLVGVLLFVTFLTLMITLVGLRGIYVNVNNANDFYDFDATSYRASSEDFFTGKETLEEGKWKLSGNKLTLTTKDEFFGEISDDFDFVKLDGFKRIKIDDDEYIRVSLVGLKTTQKKVKITFDPQNGQTPTVFKIKIGSTLDVDPPEVEQDERFPLLGWYTSQDDKGSLYMPGMRFWEDRTYYGKWTDYVREDGVLVAVNKQRLKEKMTIPSGVTSIGDEVFKDCKGLSEIIIPESVTSIGRSAFSGCTGLQTVTIGEGVTSIGSSAFSGCTGLQTITIPDSVQSIGDYAFEDCKGLSEIIIPESVTSIGGRAFSGCTGLQTITIPDGVTSIGDRAFYYCTGLQTVTIGEGVQSIGDGAFSVCSNLEIIEVKQGNPNYKSDGNCLIEKSSKKLISGCKNSIIPNYVTSIGAEAFERCTGLSEIIIPDSVTSIGYDAFCDCTGLTEITIPESVQSIGDNAFSGCTGLQTVTLGEGVTIIGFSAFSGCTGLTEITFPDSLTNIYDFAFFFCTSLQTVTIGEGVQSIGDSAFEGCTGLKSVTINAQNIGKHAFIMCTSLQTVTIGEGVYIIGEAAFAECTAMKDIYYVGDETQWEYIYKGLSWNQYYDYDTDNYYIIDYQLHFNSTGPSAASAEIAEEGAGQSPSAALEEWCAPVAWVKKQNICA